MWCRTGGAQSTGRHEALWLPIQRMVAGMDGNRTTQDALTGALSQPCQQDNWATVPRSSETQKRSTLAGAPQALAIDRRLPASALGVRRRAGELDANEGLITDKAGVVSWRDGVRDAVLDGESRAIILPGLQQARVALSAQSYI